MNNKVENSKGITLISLIITIVVLLIISNIIIYSVKNNLGIEKLKNMQNDIENLSDKISAYYNQYGTLPIIDGEYTNTAKINNLISENVDKGKFYIVDLSALENLTLTYGKDFKNINSTSDKNTLEDIYIINETSHNIFYVKGIKSDGKMYYTNYTADQVDQEAVNIKYVDNIKIPDGYTYIGKTSKNKIQIKNDQGPIFEWTDVNETLTSVPSDLSVTKEKTEEFINSVNAYKGYYKSGSAVVYLPLDEKWSTQYDNEFKYKDKSGKTITIPKGFCVSQVKGEDEISKGLVIKNNITDDRYVWVEVPKTIYETTQSEKDYENIEKDMQKYAKDYRDDNYSDDWYSGCGISNSTEYINLKNQMLRSVYEKGGFWISQYEIGADTIVTSNDKTRSPASKLGKYPYNYVTCDQAQQLAAEMDSGDLTSSLLFGIQWDLTLKFIEENEGITKNQIVEDSTSLGNYQNSKFTIYKGRYSNNSGSSYTDVNSYYDIEHTGTGEYTLLTTGATKRNSELNIFDLAGNLCEYTLEQSGQKNVIRGGTYTETGDSSSVSSRKTESDTNITGFRVGLY